MPIANVLHYLNKIINGSCNNQDHIIKMLASACQGCLFLGTVFVGCRNELNC